MKLHIFLLGLLFSFQSSLGMATEQFGPESAQKHPTSEQPGWPMGMLPLLQHESRVYSIWVNGSENFYFNAKDQEIHELIAAFSKMRLRDHEVIIKSGEPTVKPFQQDAIAHNVQFAFLGGIAHSVYHGRMEPKTLEPTLTIHLHPDRIKESLSALVVPDNIFLRYELEGSKLKSPHQLPKREVWHAKVQFPNGKPATNWEADIRTKITLWERDNPEPIHLSIVSHKGLFHCAFSPHELGELKAGTSWLTMTTGTQLTKAKPTDPRIKISQFSKDADEAPITITTRTGL